jgi:hypothetical protein
MSEPMTGTNMLFLGSDRDVSCLVLGSDVFLKLEQSTKPNYISFQLVRFDF